MKILVVGSGAREHAICWKLSQSKGVQVLCAPGNPGIAGVARLVDIRVTAAEEIASFCEREGIDLVVVGPEAALAAGVADALSDRSIPVAGPSRAAARLESSKAYAKEVMLEAGVPTAGHRVFTSRRELEAYCAATGVPIVLKADGLASGKGVFVVTEPDQLAPAIESLFGILNADVVVAEEFLSGTEVSCIYATNGVDVIPLEPAHDYKRLGDGDEGPNTGGMGAICPTPRLSRSELEWVTENVARPMVTGMSRRGTPFRGFLYAGLMVPLEPSKRPDTIRVLEFNARLGDPECQAILSHLEGGLVELVSWIAGVEEGLPTLMWKKSVSACVVIASDGYPEAPVGGDEIMGLEHIGMIPDVVVFHAGTALDGRKLVATGGRTLSVVANGGDLETARNSAYKGVDLIQMRGRRMRRDVGR